MSEHISVSPDGDPTTRSPEEIARIKQECEDIGWTVFSKKIPFGWHRGDNLRYSGWFYSFDPSEGPDGKIYGNVKDVENPENPDGYPQAIALHEFIHPLISKLPKYFKQEDMERLGFMIGANWFEDNADENYAPRAHRRGRELMRIKAEVSIGPNGGLDYQTRLAAEGKLGYIPNHMILGGMARQYFLKRVVTGELNQNGDVGPNAQIDQAKLDEMMNDPIVPEVVRDAFKEVLPYIEEFYSSIPSELPSDPNFETLVDQWAVERAKQYAEKIWPIYEKLVDKSVDDEAMRQFVEKLAKGGSFTGKNGQGGQVIIIDFDSLPEETQKEILEKMQEQQSADSSDEDTGKNEGSEQDAGQQSGGQQAGDGASATGIQSGPPQGGSKGEEQSSGQPQGSQSGEASEGDSTEGQGEQLATEKPANEQDKGHSVTEQESESENGSVPWDKLSDKAKEAVKQSYDTVSDEEKKDLENEAKQNIGEVEDEVNEHLQAHTDKEGVKHTTHLGKKQQSQNGQDAQEKKGGQEGDPGEAQDQQSGEASPNQSDTQSKGGKEKQGASGQPPEFVDTTQIGQYLDDYFSKLEVPEDELREKYKELSFVQKAGDDVVREFSEAYRMWAETNPDIDNDAGDLVEELFAILNPTEDKKKYYRKGGNRFAVHQYLKRLADKTESKLWTSERNPQVISKGLTVLVDGSSSTTGASAGEGSDETIFGEQKKMAAKLMKASAGLLLRGELHMFTDFPDTPESMKIYVEYDTLADDGDLTWEAMAGITAMERDAGGSTPTAEGITASWRRIKYIEDTDPDQKKDVNILVVMTDGVPNGGSEGVAQTKAAIEAAYQDAENNGTTLIVVGFGLGSGEENESLKEAVSTMFTRLPEDLRVEIAAVLSDVRGITVNADDIYNTFRNSKELSLVLPLIFDKMMLDPLAFRDELTL
jgi:hypothetical protein